MLVYRLTKKKYSHELSGKGAAASANRWNSKGTEIIYTANSRALAMAEVLVHLPPHLLPSDYVMLEIDIPSKIEIEQLFVTNLEEDWDSFPHRWTTQMIGDNFIDKNSHCVLKVPSAIVKGDFNYLLNPNHPDFKSCKIASVVDFSFDQRFSNR